MENATSDVSVIIPTYNESENIVLLIQKIAESFNGSGVRLEFIVVDDDSPDGTAQKAESLKNDFNLKVIVRKNRRGLATAVVRGMEEADGRILAVIDGDLQHPPDTISSLYDSLKKHDADMTIASRKVAGGGTKGWEYHRIVISSTATVIARFMLPVSLFKIRDATTGCFMFKKECVDIKKLSPNGYKIFLETLVRGRFSKPVEVPYIFNQRSKGTSKMSFGQQLLFLYHLARLGSSTGEILIPAAAIGLLMWLAAAIA
ncbi:MAG: hypothetical protein IEMM0002_0679 [bacterium]|nr:MAG: hypothetical protein IEMM0002_0679 [bacterium]